MWEPLGVVLACALALAAALAGVTPPVAAARPRVQHFVSRPDLAPPAVRVRSGPAPGGDSIFVAPKAGGVESGPMLLDRAGRLTWFRDLPGTQKAFNFRTQTYRGKRERARQHDPERLPHTPADNP